MRRGQYVFQAAGCLGCHTDVEHKGTPLAGGRALKTPFGTFYGPNITPDPQHGLGRWSEEDFRRALRKGVSPQGSNYFPAFPYPAFTGMTDADVGDLWAYLRSLAPVAAQNRKHDLKFPYSWRPVVRFWKILYFRSGPLEPDPGLNPRLNRGRYIVRAVSHCGECHTPRNSLGGFEKGMFLAGNPVGPGGEVVPNITPDKKTGIGKWSEGDLVDVLKTGMMPDGDFAGGAMGEVVKNSTSRLTDADRLAVAAFVRSVPPVEHVLPKRKHDHEHEH
ncbi:MAG: c-type cytochrome [Deltaproteobacteria bacterium]|nr:c-type cytochrome [Deltaproteobacteria bacterium]